MSSFEASAGRAVPRPIFGVSIPMAQTLSALLLASTIECRSVSYDGKWVYYVDAAENHFLKRVPIDGGTPETIVKAPSEPYDFLPARPSPHTKRANRITPPFWSLILLRMGKNPRSNSIRARSLAWHSCLRERRSSMPCGKKAWTICGCSHWMDRPAVSSRTSLRKKLAGSDIRKDGRGSQLGAATRIPTRSFCAIFPLKITKRLPIRARV